MHVAMYCTISFFLVFTYPIHLHLDILNVKTHFSNFINFKNQLSFCFTTAQQNSINVSKTSARKKIVIKLGFCSYIFGESLKLI